jgi:hypothetical protein
MMSIVRNADAYPVTAVLGSIRLSHAGREPMGSSLKLQNRNNPLRLSFNIRNDALDGDECLISLSRRPISDRLPEDVCRSRS